MTLAPEIHSPSHQSDSENHSSVDREIPLEELLAFGKRIYDRFEKTMSSRERLSALYQIDPEAFDEAVDAEVDDYLQEDPEYRELFDKFREEKQYNNKADSYVAEIKDRTNKARDFIITSLNLPPTSEEELQLVQESKDTVNLLLENIPKERKNIYPALIALGCTKEREDKPGTYIDSFPYELFPDTVNEKWEHYLDTVMHHSETKNNVVAGNADTKHANTTADELRKEAHDSVTHDVHSILQLSKFGWTEKETRLLLGRMRDSQLSIARKPHGSHKTMSPEELAIAQRLSQHHFDH